MSFWKSLLDRLYISEKEIINRFHKIYFDQHFQYDKPIGIFWQGVPVQKNPLDLWIYQEIIHELKPDLIIRSFHPRRHPPAVTQRADRIER
ncbi:MAG: hypothetical protein IH946_03765, partial [Bacteroidetes bacterium]|nr:hypothetical protein [Bacteroidota bacterium]